MFNLEIDKQALWPVFFSAVSLFLIYLARDFNAGLTSFHNSNLDVYKAIRTRIKGQKFYYALVDIIKEVYSKGLKDFQGNPEDLDEEITRMLLSAESWRRSEVALRNLEDSTQEITRVDKIWKEHASYGAKVKNVLYLLAILCLASIPIYVVNFLYVWIVWGIVLLATSAIGSLSYRKFRLSEKQFRALEHDFYVRG